LEKHCFAARKAPFSLDESIALWFWKERTDEEKQLLSASRYLKTF